MSENVRLVGTVSRGVRCPIIRQGDDLAAIVAESVLAAADSEGFSLRDRDVIAVTESVVARAQGNYATIDAIAADVQAKLGGQTLGVIFPILSRNRFSICLKGIAKAVKKVFDLRPAAIIRDLDLRKPQYKALAAYGHIGREDLGVAWEKTDRTQDLLDALK